MRQCKKPLRSMQQLNDAYYAGIEARRRGKDNHAPTILSPEERRAWRNGYNQSVTRRRQ